MQDPTGKRVTLTASGEGLEWERTWLGTNATATGVAEGRSHSGGEPRTILGAGRYLLGSWHLRVLLASGQRPLSPYIPAVLMGP